VDSEITILGTPSSMTDYTIFSYLPRAIFFLKLGAELLLRSSVAEGFKDLPSNY